MRDQWTNLVLTGKPSDCLVVITFVTEQNVTPLEVAFDPARRNLAIGFPRRCHVQIENCVHLHIDQQCHFELLNRELGSRRVVFRGVTAVESTRINPTNAGCRK